MKRLALIAAASLLSGVAFAADDTKTGGTGDSTSSVGKPADKGAGDAYLAKEFWGKHSKGGYMSKEEAAQFKGADGKTMDWQKLDADSDGKVSEREWNAYHQTAGAVGLGEKATRAPKQ